MSAAQIAPTYSPGALQSPLHPCYLVTLLGPLATRAGRSKLSPAWTCFSSPPIPSLLSGNCAFCPAASPSRPLITKFNITRSLRLVQERIYWVLPCPRQALVVQGSTEPCSGEGGRNVFEVRAVPTYNHPAFRAQAPRPEQEAVPGAYPALICVYAKEPT